MVRRTNASLAEVVYLKESLTLVRTVTSGGLPVDLSALSLVFTAELESGVNVFVARGADVVISGADDNIYTVVLPETISDVGGVIYFTLRLDETAGTVYDFAKLEVAWAPHSSPV